MDGSIFAFKLNMKLNTFYLCLFFYMNTQAELIVKNKSDTQKINVLCRSDVVQTSSTQNGVTLYRGEYQELKDILIQATQEYKQGELGRKILKTDLSYYSYWMTMAGEQLENDWLRASSLIMKPFFKAVGELNNLASNISDKKFEKNIIDINQSILSEIYNCSNQENYTNQIQLPEYIFNRLKNKIEIKTNSYTFVQNEFKTQAGVFTTPIWRQDGIGLTGSHDGGFYLMKQNGELIKRINTGFWVHATPTILRNGLFVIGSYDRYIYIINDQGYIIQKLQTGGHLFSTPVEMKNGDLLIADESGNVSCFRRTGIDSFHYTPSVFFKTNGMIHTKPIELKNGDYLISSVDHTVSRVDKNGQLLYQFKTLGSNIHSEAIEFENGNLLFGSYDKNVYVLNSKLDVVSKLNVNGWVHGSAGILSEDLYAIGTAFGEIIIFNHLNEIIRRIQTKGRVVTTPLKLDDGSLLFGSFDGNAYKVGITKDLDKKVYFGTKLWSSPTFTPDKKSIVLSGFNGVVYFVKPEIFN